VGLASSKPGVLLTGTQIAHLPVQPFLPVDLQQGVEKGSRAIVRVRLRRKETTTRSQESFHHREAHLGPTLGGDARHLG